MSLCRFQPILSAFLQRPGLPFAEVLSEATIEQAFRDAGVAPPLLISILVFIERLLIGHWPVALAALACLAGAAIWTSNNERAMEARDRALLAVPVVGGLMRRASTARFARTLGTLLGGRGVMKGMLAGPRIVGRMAASTRDEKWPWVLEDS